ncbi:phosphonopyruvate decarboxylase [Capnocytophaga cynodegmi]|uniref:phosphonopyruvate decarboxylase n=1 Tax=Capnocytophaga cynodegmi TaxID=28189 RepID=UPI00385C67C7
MISPQKFISKIYKQGSFFYAGVPDSLLKHLCACITFDKTYPEVRNIITANEGGAMGLAAGVYLATNEIPVVYLQNSGLGNIVNPLLSLHDKQVYSIPTLLIIGWRGEPGVKDEPQHVKQGEITLELLDTMGIPYSVLSKNEHEAFLQIDKAYEFMRENNAPYAIVIKKDTFIDFITCQTESNKQFGVITREEAIKAVVSNANESDVFISTTGMISRELYEIREKFSSSQEKDFLNVGSMGHVSQIALGVALGKPNRRIICLDGDGSVLMHMGGMGIIGGVSPNNLLHIMLNNAAHDSVGGQPTIADKIDFCKMALSLGYKSAFSLEKIEDIELFFKNETYSLPVFLEIKVKKGARKNLGRPKSSPVENKKQFIHFLQER